VFFNTLTFAVFLAVTLVAFWTLPGRFRVGLLLVASYVFYAWWDWRFLSLIVVSTITDYLIGRRLPRAETVRSRRQLLAVSVVVNIGILIFFKYFGFFLESASVMLASMGLEPNVPFLRIILPVGISFYTFQTLSYTADVYREKIEPETNLPRFALFVAFFPQLVAGPIERASRLLPQIRSLPTSLKPIAWSESASLIARGLFRKVVIADGVAPIVNQVFGAPDRWSALTVAMGVVGFSLQIYGDFAGYTDIARGTAKLFGIDLMQNFRAPYLARGFSEFWRRWHISLSTWLRDYLYIPLGGNRGSLSETYRNLMITMLLGGLWHGAGWGFVLWGGLHGGYLIVERALNERRDGSDSLRIPALLVFTIVTLTWIPFRAPTFTSAGEVFAGLLGPGGGDQLMFAPVALAILGLLTIAIDLADLEGNVDPVRRWPGFARGIGYGTAMVAVPLFASQAVVPFIYFQF
jgi:alginate O-acetyltransferase complex protein AlgI